MHEGRMSDLVHYAVLQKSRVRPLCGDWGDAPAWVVDAERVTCPKCLDKLKDDPPKIPAK